MKVFNPVAFLFITLGLTFLVIFHFLKNENQNMDILSNATRQTLEVKQLDVRLNENALKASHFTLLHFDGIVNDVNGLKESVRALKQSAEAVEPIAGYSLNPFIDALNTSVFERLELIEGLKSTVALARNSSNFLLAALSENETSELHLLARQVLNELQGYKIYPSQDRLKAAQIALEDFRQFVKSNNDSTNLLRHMEITFSASQEIDVYLQSLLTSNSIEKVNLILDELNIITEQHQRKSATLSYTLLTLAVLIFLAFAYVLHRWSQARNKSIRTSKLFREAVESMTEGFAFFNPEGKLAFYNSKFKSIYGDMEKHLEQGMDLNDFTALQDSTKIVQKTTQQNDGTEIEYLKDGKWILSSTTPMETGGHALVRVDISEQKKAERDLHLAATVFDNAGEAMMVTDQNNIICKINRAFSEITGYSADEVLGKNPNFLNSGRHEMSFFKDMYTSLNKTGIWQGEIWNRRKNGEIYPEWLSISTIYNQAGEVRQRVALFTDITSRKKNEERIYHQANFDPITDLPNRTLFIERFKKAIETAQRNDNRMMLMYLDLDNFKNINDTFGHIIGDTLLKEVAERLNELVDDNDTIAHISGDEFAILVTDAGKDIQLEYDLEKLLGHLNEPFNIDNNTAYTSGSIGITFFPDDGDTVESLMQNADAAMFKAKDNGRNTFCYYTPELNKRAQERHDLEIALHDALAQQHFILHYQPIVDPVSLTVISTECLVRWNDPLRGMVSPAKFIPVAEETGLIVPMGEWILKKACQDCADWIKNDGLNVGISVNLSSRQFGRCNMVELVKEALDETGLPAAKLTLEITESLLVDDDQDVLNTLRTIRDMGVLLSIDDFGTGYSSLSYLKKFPLTTLKIDQSFISGVLDNSEDSALTEAILLMAESLKLKVVAEGVENSGQAAFLLERQCDLIQGYYYSRPLPLHELLDAFTSKKLVA